MKKGNSGHVRKVLFIEDRNLQREGVVAVLERSGQWKAIVCTTPNEALEQLDKLLANDPPALVSVDLGLEDKKDQPDYGLKLLVDIRQRREGLNLVVHSTIRSIDEKTVRAVAAQGASYIYLGDGNDADDYVAVLPYIAAGFVIYSPTPAARLRRFVAARPDPFPKNPEYWTTLRLLARGLTYRLIGVEEGGRTGPIEARSIQARVRNAVLRLADLKEVALPADFSDESSADRYKPVAIQWYTQNSFRDPGHDSAVPAETVPDS